MRTKLALVVALLAGTLAPPGAAAQVPPTDPTGLVASGNVEVVTSVPNPGVVGARFRGNHMYVTSVTTGLTVYDVSALEAPQAVGRLVLPHFENEDVDLGGDILLISNDSAESAGILYVIDISDPAAPELITAYDLGIAGTGNAVVAQTLGGPGHTVSCILECSFAWMTDGGRIRVIDLRDPANPVTTGTYATPAGGIAMHDVQVDANGYVWAAGFDGAAAYELPEDYDGKGLGTLVAKTNAQGRSAYISDLGLGNGSKYNDFILHNSLRPEDSGVVYITEEDYNRPTCQGAGAFETWELPLAEVYNEYDPVTGQGIGEPRYVPTGEDLMPLDMWVPEVLEDQGVRTAMCSAHYFDLRDDIVVQGWYELGARFLDVSDPANIRQVGYYAPQTAVTWSAYWAPNDPSGEVVYVLDATRGIDVIRFDRPDSGASPTVRAPIQKRWLTGAPSGVPSTRFGYACRIPL